MNIEPVPSSQAPLAAAMPKNRRASLCESPEVFGDIYDEAVNMAVWRRQLSAALQASIQQLVKAQPTLRVQTTVAPENVVSCLDSDLGTHQYDELKQNIAELAEMFSCLFGLNRVGLRLAVLANTMCPKFHVDHVPCRLITTYQGIATEWLPHQNVKHAVEQGHRKISPAQNPQHIQKLDCGDVALLKGESWQGNEYAGLVHRSPEPKGHSRLLLTLDFAQ